MISTSATSPNLPSTLPDHTQLPESDGTFVKNFQEHPQSILLTDSIGSVLQQIHPDNQYAIGQDSGIYWRLTEPPERGAVSPDWFYVPNVPPTLNGKMRRSYVLWQEYVAPLIVLEFASGNGNEERDRTPITGKFWVYEQAIRVPYYGIYEINKSRLEVYQLIAGQYEIMSANELGRYLIPPLGVELGVWQGSYQNVEMSWLRWWDAQGNLLLTGGERADLERQEKELAQQQTEQERMRAEQERMRAEQERMRAEQERMRAEQERMRAEQLAAKLRELGIEPD